MKSYISGQLTGVFGKSPDTGVAPVSWWQVHIIPIYKTGDKSSVENYRLIILTSDIEVKCWSQP